MVNSKIIEKQKKNEYAVVVHIIIELNWITEDDVNKKNGEIEADIVLNSEFEFN